MTLTSNQDRLNKHFQNYCFDMGMSLADWTTSIVHTPPVMMEGISDKRLTMICSHKNTGKSIIFTLSFYGGKYGKGYVIRQV